MISDKLLRNLSVNKKYLIYDSIYEYVLIKTTSGYRICRQGFPSNDLFVIEKDLEDLLLDSYDSGDKDFYRDTYKDRGYTNRYKAISSVGFISVHGYFSWRDLQFFSEFKIEEDVKELLKFKKVMKSSNTKTKKNNYD